MIAHLYSFERAVPISGKKDRREAWNSNYYKNLLQKLQFAWIKKTTRQSSKNIPETLLPAVVNSNNADGEISTVAPDRDIQKDNTTDATTHFIESQPYIIPRKLYTTSKIKMICMSLIMYVLHGLISIWFGYTFSTQCMRTPVLPWLVFAHGIISLGTFIIILIIIKRDFKVHGEIRVLSSIYAVIVILGVIISIFNDNHVNAVKDFHCRDEISILLKINTPWAIGQICLLQLLIL